VIFPLLFALFALAPAGPPVVVTATAPKLVLHTGERGELEVVARIGRGFRIQANPASEPFLVPAHLEIEGDERVDVGAPVYPPGNPHRLRGSTEDLSVYENRLVIHVPVTARRGVGPRGSDDVVLEGRLWYQACNERVCLRPASAPVRAWVSLRP
jgi:hypothetical protein